jgi:RHS repeat-associated protein
LTLHSPCIRRSSKIRFFPRNDPREQEKFRTKKHPTGYSADTSSDAILGAPRCPTSKRNTTRTGAATSSPFDVSSFNSEAQVASDQPSSGAATTTANDIVLGYANGVFDFGFTVGSGFTLDTTFNSTNDIIEHKSQSSPGSISATATSSDAWRGWGDLMVAFKPGSTTMTTSATYFVHQDHLGSTRLLISYSATPGLNAQVLDSMDYLPFGEIIAGGGSTTHKFTGDERDSETGLDHTLFRQYSSSLGRWSSPDPLAGDISDPQSLNRYSYVRNNPLTGVDPLGADMIEIGGGGLNCTLDGISTSCGSVNLNDSDSSGGSGGGGSSGSGSGGTAAPPLDVNEPPGPGFGQIGGVVGMSEAYRNQQIAYSSWVNLIPITNCPASSPICTSASLPSQKFQNSIQIADALDPPVISALKDAAALPTWLQTTSWFSDPWVSKQILEMKPQPPLSQASPTTETIVCTLQGQSGTNGTYACRDAKYGTTTPILISAKSITVTCVGPFIAGQLPTIITGMGVAADSLKITSCSN